MVDRLQAKGVALRILNMNLDTNDATGKLMLQIIGSIAEFERLPHLADSQRCRESASGTAGHADTSASQRIPHLGRPRTRRDLYKSPLPLFIFENDHGQSWCVCGQARYVREPQLRAASPPCARRVRDDGPPDGDDARQRGGERPPDGDAHAPDASVSVPFTLLLPESEQSSMIPA
jgi:Resolvase, N terminal domain